MKRLTHIIITSILVLSPTFASEMDSLTNRHLKLSDSSDFFNKKVNQYLFEIQNEANKKSNCDAKKIKKVIKKKLVADINGMFVFSPLQRLADDKNAKGFEKREILMKDSIYKYVKRIDAPVLKMFPLSATLNINGIIIGSDKFSHFFNLGHGYYIDYQNKKKSVLDIIISGKKAEAGFWGGPTTGVISNSDLMANFQGMRFFGHLLGEGIDPLTHEENNDSAYFKCNDKQKWELIREFKWSTYFDSSVDEGVNCNTYFKESIQESIFKAIDELETTFSDGTSFHCPIVKNTCQGLNEKYSEFKEYLLSPECK